MKLLLLILCISSTIVSCSTSDKKSKQELVAKFEHSTSGPERNNNKIPVSAPKIVKGKFNISNEIKKILPENWENEFWFEKIDNKNGFARMGGYMEGYINYYLFVGLKGNLLVEVSWGCGPACEQVVKFYESTGKTYKSVSFARLLNSADLEVFGNQIETCSSSKSFNSWSNKKCSIMLDFPETGTVVNVFRAQFFDDDKFQDNQDNHGNEGKRIAELDWDRKNFKFVEIR